MCREADTGGGVSTGLALTSWSYRDRNDDTDMCVTMATYLMKKQNSSVSLSDCKLFPNSYLIY